MLDKLTRSQQVYGWARLGAQVCLTPVLPFFFLVFILNHPTILYNRGCSNSSKKYTIWYLCKIFLFLQPSEFLINYLPRIAFTHREVMSATIEMQLPVGGKRLGITLVHIGNKNCLKSPLILKKVITTVRGCSGHLNEHFIFYNVCYWDL